MKCKYCGNESMLLYAALKICNDCRNKDLINNCINSIYIEVECLTNRLSIDRDLLIWDFANYWLKLEGLKFVDRKKLKRSIINKYKEVYNEMS